MAKREKSVQNHESRGEGHKDISRGEGHKSRRRTSVKANGHDLEQNVVKSQKSGQNSKDQSDMTKVKRKRQRSKKNDNGQREMIKVKRK